jgi:hypothetical protein
MNKIYEWIEREVEMFAAIKRVRELHKKDTRDSVSFCVACIDHDKQDLFAEWPCDTIKALDEA